MRVRSAQLCCVAILTLCAPNVYAQNLEDLTSRLERLSEGQGNFVQRQQRLDLANEILRIDPNVALANLEVGKQKVEDYYIYHNAVILPDFPDNVRLAEGASSGLRDEDRSNAIFVSDLYDISQIESQGGVILRQSQRANSALEQALPYFEAAIESDPSLKEVYDHFMRIALIKEEYKAVLPRLETMLLHFGEESRPWLYFGLVQHCLGNEAEAVGAFRDAFERMSPEEREVFNAVDHIRSPRADSLSTTEESSFWQNRDPRHLTSVNERKLEHYARIVQADLLYGTQKLDILGRDTERGEVYLRYGKPDLDVKVFGCGPPIPLCHAIWDYGDFKFVFKDYDWTGNYEFITSNNSRFDYVTKARETFRGTPEQYDYDAPGKVQSPYRLAAFRGENGNADLVLGYGIPLRGRAISRYQDVGVTLRTGAFLISNASNALAVERRRTIEGLPGNQIVKLDSVALWTNAEALIARPGEYDVAFEFETTDGSAWAAERKPIEVPDFSGGGLKMSEILLAYAVEPGNTEQMGTILRDGLIIQPAPWGVYGTENPIYLYFEIYGLGMSGDQTNYQVEAELRPKDERNVVERIFRDREPGVSNAFPVQADRQDDSQYVILDASGQPPGEYTLTVRVEDRVSGQVVEQETQLFLE